MSQVTGRHALKASARSWRNPFPRRPRPDFLAAAVALKAQVAEHDTAPVAKALAEAPTREFARLAPLAPGHMAQRPYDEVVLAVTDTGPARTGHWRPATWTPRRDDEVEVIDAASPHFGRVGFIEPMSGPLFPIPVDFPGVGVAYFEVGQLELVSPQLADTLVMDAYCEERDAAATLTLAKVGDAEPLTGWERELLEADADPGTELRDPVDYVGTLEDEAFETGGYEGLAALFGYTAGDDAQLMGGAR